MRMIYALASTVILIYVGMCALLYFTQRQILYLPQYTKISAENTDFEITVNALRLRGWRVNPGQKQALLYYGGNAEAVQGQREAFAQWFPKHTIYLMAYRGYGASEGQPDEAALKADALAVYDAIISEHQSVDVLGRSVGSGIALHLAARRPISRLALITPYDSMTAVAAGHYPFFPVDWLLHQRFEASADAAKIDVPSLLLIARQDQIIPPEHAEALARAFIRRLPQIQWLDTDHNSVELDLNFAWALQRHFGENQPYHASSRAQPFNYAPTRPRAH